MVIQFIIQIQQSDGSKCYNRLIWALISKGFYTEVLVPLEGLSSGVYQRRLFRYHLVIVSMAVVRRMSILSYYCFWTGGLLERVTIVCVSERDVALDSFNRYIETK